MMKLVTIMLMAGVFIFAAGLLPTTISSGVANACDDCVDPPDPVGCDNC